MLSQFGQVLRKMRIDRQELLKEMADKLGVSSAYLSSVETGRKRVPNGWVSKIKALYDLTPEEGEALDRAAAASSNEIRIPVSQTSDKQRELAFSFAKALDGLTDQDVERLMKAIKSTKRGETRRASKYRG